MNSIVLSFYYFAAYVTAKLSLQNTVKFGIFSQLGSFAFL